MYLYSAPEYPKHFVNLTATIEGNLEDKSHYLFNFICLIVMEKYVDGIVSLKGLKVRYIRQIDKLNWVLTDFSVQKYFQSEMSFSRGMKSMLKESGPTAPQKNCKTLLFLPH